MKNDYTTYNALDFAQDDWFIKWVKTTDPEANEFWTQWLSDHPDKQKVIKEAKQFVQNIRVNEQEPSTAKVHALWAKIDAATKEETPAKIVDMRPKSRTIWPYIAAAVVAALLIFTFLPRGTYLQTDYGELLVHELPDGSKVELNAGSKLNFNPKKWKEERIVQLEGEAFFEVEKGARFLVETPNGRVQVLGTSFNVFSRDKNLEVECFTGRVEVALDAQHKQILTPGEATKKIDGNQLEEKTAIDINKRAGWRRGQLDLVKVPLQRVYEELERQFDIDVKTDNLKQEELSQIVNAYFEKTVLDSALTRVTWPFSLDYEINGNEVIILK